ncbi:hypothetical protein BJV78DRAFT_356052 [Lactifluus subvellereus]|nr:hypothetical protein BJV78DRAFT_356052 [Lactifluus subvellereus]
MLVVSVVMYTVSASHWALTTTITVRWVRIGELFITPIEALAFIYVPPVNFILSDCIILWRSWVLWNRRFILFIPPLIFMLCTLVISVADAVFAYEGSKTKRKADIVNTRVLRWCICGLTISTNLWATCLLFIRAWYFSPALVDVYCMTRRVL